MLGMPMTYHQICDSMLEMRNVGYNNNISDDDTGEVDFSTLFLERTLVGKDDRVVIHYWALQLMDNLDAFNNFTWGTFIYIKTFDFLSTCIVNRGNKHKERLESPTKQKVERPSRFGQSKQYPSGPCFAMPLSKKQFKHETYKWNGEMTDYVIGKKPVEAREHWRKVNGILFPTNVNENHWVAIAFDLKKRVIKVYDSLLAINTELEIANWTSCLGKMLPSLLVHTMSDIYNDALPFSVQRPEKDIPNQRNRYTTNELM
ncbi:hypothetical protein Dsin_011592 [Dipteronia sinensis]|uniref:Ubiquitin-like protease family profile domain-containing protein n=1 Tax=Dipteronia sinensis TaxID=43782 RepID=A0AAE0AUW9_9ROSI|nr:hypothetical protein Dsin_011592 [Dipteronia sinensis]